MKKQLLTGVSLIALAGSLAACDAVTPAGPVDDNVVIMNDVDSNVDTTEVVTTEKTTTAKK